MSILNSLILAIAAWAITYFTPGNEGGNYLYAPIVIAVVSSFVQWYQVYMTEDQPVARGMVESKSKLRKLIIG